MGTFVHITWDCPCMNMAYHHETCIAASGRGLHTSGYAWPPARYMADTTIGLAAIQCSGLHIALLEELDMGLLLCTVMCTD